VNKQEVVEKFADAKLYFDSYYKYQFQVSGVHDGYILNGTIGDGSSDAIYKQSMSRESSDCIYNCDWLEVKDKDGSIIFTFDGYDDNWYTD
jgi:hypothetical protein